MDSIELIQADGKALAYIIKAELLCDRTTFVTPNDLTMQVGFVVYPAGGEIARHTHRPLQRHIVAWMSRVIGDRR